MAPTVRKRTPVGLIKFFCPGALPEWRARTLLTKEPETLEWIDRFSAGDVLWDIGANVGVYSLYAAFRKVRVLAFEPSAPNYYVLNRNIEINELDSQISAYCLAFSDETGLDVFYMLNTTLGGAMNSFGEQVDWEGKPFKAETRQAMIGYTIDDFLQNFQVDFPTHMKIDVDGIENKIIVGAKQTLSDSRLKSLLVELDSARPDYCSSVIRTIESAGMKFVEKRHAPMFDNSRYAACFNYFFAR
ncbi:MAG TPA: FkbM family methyltransferase [Terriglobia bacterium]|nr:FkbM family methyltransferase [Terriglobia bacterium]